MFTFSNIIEQFIQTSIIEWVAFLFGVLQVFLALKNKVGNFYAGIFSTSLYIYLFFHAGLFAESVLNFYYLIVSFIGILLWNRKVEKKELSISTMKPKEWGRLSLLIILLFCLQFFILKKYTQSTVPFADAFVSTMAWCGTLLLIYRKIENWILLNVSNFVAVPLLIYKGLQLTSILTIIYIIVAILGFIAWKKELENQKTSTH